MWLFLKDPSIQYDATEIVLFFFLNYTVLFKSVVRFICRYICVNLNMCTFQLKQNAIQCSDLMFKQILQHHTITGNASVPVLMY